MKKNNKKNYKELYLPVKVRVLDVINMTSDTRLYRIERPEGFYYSPGHFVMISLWGAGEIPISITSTDGIHNDIELCIRKVGFVTSALNNIKADDFIGIRGPLGNGFSFENAAGKDILFVAGGIGIAPLRSLINLVLTHREKFGSVALIYGSRNPSEVLFKEEVLTWETKGLDLTLTVDRKGDEWNYQTGLVTEHLDKQKISLKDAFSYICGPHEMIKAVMRDLSLMGMPEGNIITSLEAHMKCGVGKCGHCYAGSKYICTDGPVFSFQDIKRLNLYSP